MKRFLEKIVLLALLMPLALSGQTYQSVPYFQGFESSAGNPPIPQGWILHHTGDVYGVNYPRCFNSANYSHTGGWLLMMQSSTGQVEVIATPPFENLASKRASFWVASRAYTSIPTVFEVGVMEDTVFVPVDTIDIAQNTVPGDDSYHRYQVDFDTYTGNGHRIAFRCWKSSGHYLVYIDDFLVTTAPQCQYSPGAVDVSNISDVGATLSWGAADSSAGYFIQFSNNSLLIPVEDTTFTFSNLSPNTLYVGNVYNSCDGIDTSQGSPFSFLTPCSELVLPYFEGFEGCLFSVPPCWTQVVQYLSLNYNYPCVVFAFQCHGGECALGFNRGLGIVATPLIPLPANQIEVDGWIRTNDITSFSSNPVEVGYMTDLDNMYSFVPVDTIYSTQEFSLFHVYFTHLTLSDSVYVAFRTDNSNYSPTLVDDLVIRQARSCFDPADFRCIGNPSHQVSLTWVDTNNTHWEVAYGPMGFNPDSAGGNLVSNIYSDTVDITGLSNDTIYDFYLRADCNGNYSYWLGPITMEPNVYDMHANENDTIRTCGIRICDDGGPAADFSGMQHSTLVVFPEDSSQRVVLTGVVNTVPNYYNLENTLTIYDGVGTSGRVLGTYVNATNVPMRVASESGPVTIEFQTQGYVGEGYWLDVSCVPLTTCPDPYEIFFSNIASTSALVSWTYGPNGVPDRWIIEAEDTASDNTYFFYAAGIYNNCYITGLTERTRYQVRIRAICTTGDTSGYVYGELVTPCNSEGEVAVGSGDEWIADYPIYTPRGFGVCQFVIPAAELADVGNTISGLALQSYCVDTNNVNVDIYIDTTSLTSISSPSDFVVMAPSRRLFSGVVRLQTGLNYFYFDSAWVIPDSSLGIVVTIDNNTAVSAGNRLWKSHTGNTIFQYSDYYNVNPTLADDLVNITDIGSYQPDVVFLTPCTPTNCVAPNIVAFPGTNDIVVGWIPGNSESLWRVMYKRASSPNWTIYRSSTSLNSCTITGLDPNTLYDVGVVSICDNSINMSTAQVRTGCAQVDTLPFYENFEHFLAPTESSSFDQHFEPCWGRGPIRSAFWNYPYLSQLAAHSGANSMYLFDDRGRYQCRLVLPEMGVDVDSLTLSYWSLVRSVSAGYKIEVGVMTDPDDVGTFVVVDTFDYFNGDVGHWVNHIVEFWNYSGTGRYIAFRTNASHRGNVLIDDISVYRSGSCRRVSDISVESVGVTSANIRFADAFSAGSYTVLWGTSDRVEDATDSMDISSLSYTITGLSSGVQYKFWIRTNCASQHSLCAYGGSFVTQCDIIEVTPTMPYHEDFENGIPPCFSQEQISNQGHWIAGEPAFPVIDVHGGLYSAICFTWSSSITRLILPEMDFSSLDYGAEIEFWQARPIFGGDVDNLFLFYRTNDTEDWVLFSEYTDRTGGTWSRNILLLPNSANAPFYQVSLLAVNQGGYGVFIDDIEILDAHNCRVPENLSARPEIESAEVAWISPADNALVQYRPTSSEEVESTAVAGNSATLEGLAPNTQYQFRVMAICSNGDSSIWSDWCFFTTGSPERTYVVSVAINRPDWGRVTGAGRYSEGSVCTLTAIPLSNAYQFFGWNVTIPDNPYSFTVTRDVEFTAYFVNSDGIDEIHEGVGIDIYPNPASDHTTVRLSGESGTVRIAIVDICGRTKVSEVFECSADCQQSLDVSHLAKGTYFVCVTFDRGSKVSKLVIMN